MVRRPSSHLRSQKEIKEMHEHACAWCWQVNKKQARGHHIIKYSENGSDHISNFVTLCDDCHRQYHRGELSIDILSI
jgi:5-methylcytosine-specific restriction endonuclease McrA